MLACLPPSAFSTWAWRSPSATVMFAWRLPSDSVTAARRVRSADIWRFIASWTSRGGTTSRISTAVTLTPQRSVTSSSLRRRSSLICSRRASTSSSEMSPMTARNVVAAMPCEALAKLVTATTLANALVLAHDSNRLAQGAHYQPQDHQEHDDVGDKFGVHAVAPFLSARPTA